MCYYGLPDTSQNNANIRKSSDYVTLTIPRSSSSQTCSPTTNEQVIMSSIEVYTPGRHIDMHHGMHYQSQVNNKIGWLLEFYVLTTAEIISGLVLTCDSVNSWWGSSAGALGDQATSTMTWYSTQSHDPDTELTSPYTILIMSSAKLESDKYQFYKSLVWLDRESNFRCPNGRAALYCSATAPDCKQQDKQWLYSNMNHQFITSSIITNTP